MALIRASTYLCTLIFLAAVALIVGLANSAPVFASCLTTESAGYRDDLAPGLDELLLSHVTCGVSLVQAYPLSFAGLFLLFCIVLAARQFWRPQRQSTEEKEMPNVPTLTTWRQHNIRQHELAGGSSPPSIISAGVTLSGNIQADGDFQIDGTVNGDVTCACLVISESGRVIGDVVADKVMVRGSLQGALRAGHVVLSSGCEVEATIKQASFVVEAGAKFVGQVISIQNPSDVRTALALTPDTISHGAKPHAVRIK